MFRPAIFSECKLTESTGKVQLRNHAPRASIRIEKTYARNHGKNCKCKQAFKDSLLLVGGGGILLAGYCPITGNTSTLRAVHVTPLAGMRQDNFDAWKKS